MIKVLYHILVICALLTAASCNSEKKVHESTSTTSKKKKQKGVVVTKYNKILKHGDANAKLEAAIMYFEKEDYVKSITLLESVISIFRGTKEEAKVRYYYAFSNYYIGDFIVAAYQFKTYVRNFPGGEHAELCAYTQALCYFQSSPTYSLEQKDTYIAIDAFQHFLNKYPNSQYTEACNEKLDILRNKLVKKSYENSKLYYHMGLYKSAIIAIENHIKDFSDSKYIEEMSYLILKSHYLLAINSIESKKNERFKASIDSYLKFVNLFPNSIYIKDAEEIYTKSIKEYKST